MPRYNVPDGKGSSVFIQAPDAETALEMFDKGIQGSDAAPEPGFNFAGSSVTAVMAWVDEDPTGERAREALEAETGDGGKNRRTLVGPLSQMVSAMDALAAANAANGDAEDDGGQSGSEAA